MQVFETIALVVMTDGKTQEKAIPEHYEKLRVLEEGMKELFPYGSPFDEKQMGILDILLLSTFGAYKAQEQVLGLKVIDPEKNPLIFSRINSLINLPVMKDLIPAHELQVEILRTFRNNVLKSTSA